jgi:ParB family chromosome partitioning protein
MVNKQTQSLGKGLSALLGEDLSQSHSVDSLSLRLLRPNPLQPRRHFNPDSLRELVASVREKGVLQPILVRSIEEAGRYEIIAGERRYRAAQEVGLESISAIILECTEAEALEIGLIENLQREDLNPLEEALCLERLMQNTQRTQDDIAKTIGKSRSYVANTVRLNQLEDRIKDLLRTTRITAGHARALLNSNHAFEIAQTIIEKNLSVRETEQLVRKLKTCIPEKTSPPLLESEDNLKQDMEALAARMSSSLKTPVHFEAKRGKLLLTLEFQNWEEFDTVYQRVCQPYPNSTDLASNE